MDPSDTSQQNMSFDVLEWFVLHVCFARYSYEELPFIDSSDQASIDLGMSIFPLCFLGTP